MAGTDYRVEARAVWERGVRSDVAMQAEIEAAIAAAEERGRRRGVEERDTAWRDALCAAMGALGTSVIINNRGTEKLNALYAGNLAPRDSAPQPARDFREEKGFRK